jgi:GNAT superfamily N-acetyltransferase
MPEYTIKALGPETWDAFADLAERHNGVWNGCWCTWFHAAAGSGGRMVVVRDDDGHPACAERGQSAAGNRVIKERLVNEGRAHAALVFDGDVAVAWCEYGTPEELPNIYHRKEYEAGLGTLPDYRLTCFFVDKNYRRKGVAGVALRGALDLIARAGGGMVEAYPQDTPGKKVSASFLYNATRSLFEQAGFRYDRSKGAKNCVMSKKVAQA